MGNCIKPTTKKQQEEEVMRKDYQEYEEKEMEAGFEKERGHFDDDGNLDDVDEKGGLKVKILLTKEELEWLMFQLKVNNGGKKIKDILIEIERERVKGTVNQAWKPSLESIMECPED